MAQGAFLGGFLMQDSPEMTILRNKTCVHNKRTLVIFNCIIQFLAGIITILKDRGEGGDSYFIAI